jgi:hypothetical protein
MKYSRGCNPGKTNRVSEIIVTHYFYNIKKVFCTVLNNNNNI